MDVPASDCDVLPVGTEWDHGVTGLLEFSNFLLSIQQILVHRCERVALALCVLVRRSHDSVFEGHQKNFSWLFEYIYPRRPPSPPKFICLYFFEFFK